MENIKENLNLKENIKDKIKQKTLGIQSFKKSFKILLVDPEENETEISFLDFGRMKKILIDTGRSFRPGLYKIEAIAFEGSDNEVVSETEFELGLVNINTPKSIYLHGENSTVIVGVLNKYGRRITDAFVTVKIITPLGVTEEFSTKDKVVNNNDGTYNLSYQTKGIGIYKVYARAIWEDVDAEYETVFEVRENVEFDILRKSETVIYPDSPSKTR
jgi:hypothetical protein